MVLRCAEILLLCAREQGLDLEKLELRAGYLEDLLGRVRRTGLK